MNQNLYDLLISDTPEDRARMCLETSDGRGFTFGDADEHSARFANLLASRGVASGDRVAVQVEKSPEAVFLYLACLRIGAVYLPLNSAYTREETAYFLADAHPRAVICAPERSEESGQLCRGADVPLVLTLGRAGEGSLSAGSRTQPAAYPCAPVTENASAAILYSSGTTGKPKGALLTHGNLASNARALVEAWAFTKDDILLHALPIFHVHGLFVALHCAMLSRSRLLFLSRFDTREVCSLLPRASVFMGVPTHYTRLLAVPQFNRAACANLRLLISGSAPLAATTFEQALERTGHRILERYGMTETLMNTSNPLEGARVPGSVGLPLPGIEVRVSGDADLPLGPGEVGEIQIRGPNVFPGYWKKPDLTAARFTHDGYFRTGDLGSISQDRYVYIMGRSKDMIISGGYNVYPKEVEDVIHRFEGVLESAVIGMPHPDFGEGVMAVVVARSGAAIAIDRLATFLRSSLANYKLPKLITVAPELPRNAMGKVQKNRLREMYLTVWHIYLEKAHLSS